MSTALFSMRQSFLLSTLSFFLSFGIAVLYWALRAGFLENSILTVFKVLGISAFISMCPIGFSYFRKYFSRGVNAVLLNDTILPVYALVLIAFTGYASAIMRIDVSAVFVFFGYIFLAIGLSSLIRQFKILNTLLIVLVAGCIAAWVAGVSWLWYLKPYILENWAYGTDKIDTLFHVALAQMIKTYGVPSTGLDGLPPMTYHWGSHWLFAQLSKFLQLPVVVVYQLCYPVIIAPLLFRSFLSFVLEVKQAYKPELPQKHLNFFFWIIFLSVFIGFFRSFFRGNTWAEFTGGGTGSTIFILISESYCLSIIIMMACLSVLLNLWRNRNELAIAQQSVSLFLLLPFLLAFLGIVKISTLFVICCLIGYLFLRLKMFDNKLYIAAIVVFFVIALWMLRIGFETKEDHGGLSLFYFYNNWNISIPQFLFLFYLWTYIFLVVYVLKEKLFQLSIREFLASPKLIPIECALCIALAGFVPSAILTLQNFDALYFTEIQMWISASLVLVYIPFYTSGYRSRKKLLLQILIAIPIGYFMFTNTRSYYGNVYVESIRHHEFVLKETGHYTAGMRIREMITKTDSLSEEDYQTSKVLSFLLKLRKLDKLPIEQKSKSLLFIDFRTLITRTDYNWNLGCHNIALTAPALSGIAMIDGFDVTYYELCGGCCEQIEFVYGYYPKWKTRQQINEHQPLEDLKDRVREKGFEYLIYFDLQSEEFAQVKV